MSAAAIGDDARMAARRSQALALADGTDWSRCPAPPLAQVSEGEDDCARDPAVYAALIDSRLEFRCLYSGRLPRELEMAAPQLVELLPGHRLTQRVLGEGWGRSWGVFMRIDDPSNQDESGRQLLFRFYDPRVLRVSQHLQRIRRALRLATFD